MTRKELIEQLAQRNNLSFRASERLVLSIFEEWAQALERGERIEFRGFGVFSVKSYQPYKARNPKNGTSVYVGKRNRVRFKASTQLHEQINNTLL